MRLRGVAAAHSGKPLAFRRTSQIKSWRGSASPAKKVDLVGKAEPYRSVLWQSRFHTITSDRLTPIL